MADRSADVVTVWDRTITNNRAVVLLEVKNIINVMINWEKLSHLFFV